MVKNIVNNGLNFISFGLKCLFDEALTPDEQIKFAVINFYTGLELLLKSLLAHNHFTLIIDNIDKYKKENFENGDFHTASFEKIISRLDNICKIKFDDKIYKSFNELRKVRNKIIHLHYKENKNEVIIQLLNAWQFLFLLLEREIFNFLDSDQWAKATLIRIEMNKLQGYIDTRYQAVLEDIEDSKKYFQVITCPYCRKKSTILTNEGIKCLVCNQFMDPNSFSDDWMSLYHKKKSSLPHYPWGNIGYCKSCENISVVPKNSELEQIQSPWFCLNCHKEFNDNEFIKCITCSGKLFGETDENTICYECREANMWEQIDDELNDKK